MAFAFALLAHTTACTALHAAHAMRRLACLQDVHALQVDMFRSFLHGVGLMPGEASVLLVDPACIRNFGDTMLGEGELSLFASVGWDHGTVVQCKINQALRTLENCFALVEREGRMPHLAVALLPAGGNWGSLYKRMHGQRMKLMRALLKRNVTVIGMPQSMFYADDKGADEDARRIASNAATYPHAASRMTLLWREPAHLSKARALFPSVRNELFVDVALHLGPLLAPRPAHAEVLFLCRNDDERTGMCGRTSAPPYRPAAALRAR
ncbi:hypothetical protein KFE25_006808 [Diacronema lutheri]|uniref:Uncharacterized protein n=1 Tax=Diacronema lutheri TaxID=2081491 RepID=A0A8J5XF98_DIALT|nr:hypothetical protein KFE25_006808 [Diacronema lutheri]